MTVAGKVTFGAPGTAPNLMYSSTPGSFGIAHSRRAPAHQHPDTFRLNAPATKARNVGHRFYAFDVGKGRAAMFIRHITSVASP